MRKLTLLSLVFWSTALTFGAKPTSYPVIPLKLTVNATQQFDPLTGTATIVSSDGNGQYVDGQDGVCASLDDYGNLIIHFNCKSSSTPRRLGWYVPTQLAPPTSPSAPCTILYPVTSPSNPTPAYTNNITTVQATDKTTAAFQVMQTYDGTSNTIYYIQFFIGTAFSDANQTTYRLNYHRTNGYFPTDAAMASYAQVRRMSATQWVLESVTPSGLSGTPPNVAMLMWLTTQHNQSTATECGFYQVPFSFTLDAK